jgi:hypothetical protein
MKHDLGWEIKQPIKIMYRILLPRFLLSVCSNAKNVFPERLHQCSVVTFFQINERN